LTVSSRRTERLNEQLKREITQLIRRRLRDPRVAGVTVTGVDVTNDLWFARVYVSLPDEQALRTQALAGLEAATPFIRRELGSVLHVRRIPDLRFLEDRTEEAAQRIEDLLRTEADERIARDGGEAVGRGDDGPEGEA
jgi:ribosome-binding factor A